jgi:hypothetical protein
VKLANISFADLCIRFERYFVRCMASELELILHGMALDGVQEYPTGWAKHLGFQKYYMDLE